jgi:hypothetical protein
MRALIRIGLKPQAARLFYRLKDAALVSTEVFFFGNIFDLPGTR